MMVQMMESKCVNLLRFAECSERSCMDHKSTQMAEESGLAKRM